MSHSPQPPTIEEEMSHAPQPPTIEEEMSHSPQPPTIEEELCPGILLSSPASDDSVPGQSSPASIETVSSDEVTQK